MKHGLLNGLGSIHCTYVCHIVELFVTKPHNTRPTHVRGILPRHSLSVTEPPSI